MLTNGIPVTNGMSSECCAPTVSGPNIHDILMKIDAVLSEANEQAGRICTFLMSQPMAKAEKEPCGACDMLTHVIDLNEKASALHNKITDISQILGM